MSPSDLNKKAVAARMNNGGSRRARRADEVAARKSAPVSSDERVRAFYAALSAAWGPQHWWPAQTRFEVIVGAFLTQNTAWTNVERAMANLRAAGALCLDTIRLLPIGELEQLIRPSGYFRQKAQRLKSFIAYLDEHYEGSLDRMFARPTADLRTELLALNGIGPETADSILLYAGDHPVFVVDAYTRRIVERHGLLPAGASYEDIRTLFESALRGDTCETSSLPPAAVESIGIAKQMGRLPGAAHEPSPVSMIRRTAIAQRFNEMHALIVGVGKNHCFKTQAKCDGCPLQSFLPSPVLLSASSHKAKSVRRRTKLRN